MQLVFLTQFRVGFAEMSIPISTWYLVFLRSVVVTNTSLPHTALDYVLDREKSVLLRHLVKHGLWSSCHNIAVVDLSGMFPEIDALASAVQVLVH